MKAAVSACERCARSEMQYREPRLGLTELKEAARVSGCTANLAASVSDQAQAILARIALTKSTAEKLADALCYSLEWEGVLWTEHANARPETV